MRYLIFVVAVLTTALALKAGLPPTQSKGSNESAYATTFNFNWGALPVSRTGTTVTFGTMPVSGGGTGLTSFNNYDLLAGSGTAIAQITAGTSGTLLFGTTGFPEFRALSNYDVVTALGYIPSDDSVVGASFTLVNSTLSTHAASITSLTGDLSSVSATVAGLESDIDSVSSTVASLSTDIDTVSSTVAGITSSQWITTGSDIYYNAGSVGVGTSTPTTRLSVSGGNISVQNSAAASSGIYLRDGNSTRRWGLSAGTTGTLSIINDTAGTFPVQINGSAPNNSININGSGNVALGSSLATYNLSVVSATNGATQIGVVNSSAGSSAYSGIILENNTSNSYINFYGSGFSPSVGYQKASGLSIINTAGDAIIGSSSSTGNFRVFTGGDNERLTIASTGTVTMRLGGTPTSGAVIATDANNNLSFQPYSTAETLAVSNTTATTSLSTSNDFIAASGTVTVNLPSAVSQTGKVIRVKKTSDGNSVVTVQTIPSTEKIDSGLSFTTVVGYNDSVSLVSDGTGWKITDYYFSKIPTTNTTINVSAVTTAPTKGSTRPMDKVTWYRDGCYMVATYNYEHTNAGSAGSGEYLVQLPQSYVADTRFVTATTVASNNVSENSLQSSYIGDGTFGIDGGARGYMKAYLYNNQFFRLSFFETASSYIIWNSGYWGFGNANLGFTATIRVPINGWCQ